jgi:hypothetical protein
MENQQEILITAHVEKDSNIEVQQLISLNKFIFLSIISLGLYEVWWIYKAWRFYQQKEKSDILPAVRAIFSIFFLISLFNRNLNFAKAHGYRHRYSPVLLYIGAVFVSLLACLPDPFWLVSYLSIVFFIPPFKAFNYARQHAADLRVVEQTSFSIRQIVLIVIGSIFWAICFIGLAVGR